MFNAIVPEKLRRPWFTAPLCVLSLSLGMLLLFFLVFPWLYPEIHDRIACRNMRPMVAGIGSLCVLFPVMLLLWATRDDGP